MTSVSDQGSLVISSCYMDWYEALVLSYGKAGVSYKKRHTGYGQFGPDSLMVFGPEEAINEIKEKIKEYEQSLKDEKEEYWSTAVTANRSRSKSEFRKLKKIFARWNVQYEIEDKTFFSVNFSVTGTRRVLDRLSLL